MLAVFFRRSFSLRMEIHLFFCFPFFFLLPRQERDESAGQGSRKGQGEILTPDPAHCTGRCRSFGWALCLRLCLSEGS